MFEFLITYLFPSENWYRDYFQPITDPIHHAVDVQEIQVAFDMKTSHETEIREPTMVLEAIKLLETGAIQYFASGRLI